MTAVSDAASPDDVALLAALADAGQRMRSELGKRIVGQHDVIERLLISLFAGGHALIVGVPGLAKTSLIAALAECLSMSFGRIQFTPDLMPADITGSDVLQHDADGTRRFQFAAGPIFANILLADEINRTPPKTQAALLQAMQEGKVTVGGHTHPLPQPFMVFATQNPIEQQGTYPLPEAQLDRFLMQINIGYPSAAEEAQIAQGHGDAAALTPIVTPADLLAMQALVHRLPTPEHVVLHAVQLTRLTRPDTATSELVRASVAWGAGPRASQSLLLAARARAAAAGRPFVEMADVDAVARPVLEHRLVMSYRGQADGHTPAAIIDHIIERLAAS
ncbi:MAG: MoxR family ATPase [Myxococcales bacterium]|nr:MoxR family ATPase [Myxococcales bacterium]